MISVDCKRDDDGVPVIGKKDLNHLAEEVLNDFNPLILKEPKPTDIDAIAEFYLGACIECRTLTQEQKVLGATVFDDGVITVYDRTYGYIPIRVSSKTILIEQGVQNTKYTGRQRFTLAHEAMGHLLLHQDVKCLGKTANRLVSGFEGRTILCRPDEVLRRHSGPMTKLERLEWQADYMAAAGLMPETTFRMAVELVARQHGYMNVGSGKKLFFVHLSFDLLLRQDLVFRLSRIFEVSQQAAWFRFSELYAEQLKVA